MSHQFTFLQPEFPEVHEAAQRAESLAKSDPRASCFYARRTLELSVVWACRHDPGLQLPYRDDLSALIHEPTFRNTAGQAVFYKCRAIKDLGNSAVHSRTQLSASDAVSAVRELFHVCFWLVRTYAQGVKPEAGLTFDPALLPDTATVPKQTLRQLQGLNDALAAEREKYLASLAEKESLDEELKRVRAEVAAAKKANGATPDAHDYSEAETRDLFIDLLLKESGWPLDRPEDREYEVAGMPNSQNRGFVDYVLWGDDGKPLGLVEAKRTRRDSRLGQQQAKLYADCLEAKFGKRPVIFFTNGYEHWIWDDAMYPPRQVQGFYNKSEIELLIQRRAARRVLGTARIDDQIVERYYQTRSIRRIGEAFERDHARRALLVMATGAGKTRTVIALCDVLMRANWAKRILFLADRTALVNQAVGAFKRHLPDAAPVNLVTEKNTEGRVYVSTYPTMLHLIDETKGNMRRFGPGHFDLVIIDEAHRSVFLKYGAIFDYFDSLLVGLTATPKDDVNRSTYRLFELEGGVPTDAYSLSEAVSDSYLVPAKSVSVPLKLPTTGIVYDQLSDEEKEHFEITDWKDRAKDVLETKRVEAPAINKWLFNVDTVDKVLKHLMERGLKVDGGDTLGKTILFAKNHDHAAFIADRFNKNYPIFRGEFARVIDFKIEYAQDLIDKFSNPKRLPQIAISVDMLDTGIDIPEVVNLVFFKQVRSKTKFWQMVGRGTRLCPDLFGPGLDKACFYIFDYCGNLEFFSQNLEGTEGSSAPSIGKRLFTTRLRLVSAISSTREGAAIIRDDRAQYGGEPTTVDHVLRSILDLLKAEVGAMNTDNFIVRAKRRFVEKYQDNDTWMSFNEEKLAELEDEIAGLPSGMEPEAIETKLFDLLMLRLQLSILKPVTGFKLLKQQLVDIAASLEESSNIPVIRAQLNMIQALQTETWWEGVTVPMVEVARLRLRSLAPLIEYRRGNPVYTDFGDVMGPETEVPLSEFKVSVSFEQFKYKARAFLQAHLDNAAVHRLRLGIPLTPGDIDELQRILVESGTGDATAIQKAVEGGLGVFVRSLVGMDREAARRALNQVVAPSTLTANQIEFMNMIANYLTENGIMEPGSLYESPFTDIAPLGPERLFSEDVVERLLSYLEQVRETAGTPG